MKYEYGTLLTIEEFIEYLRTVKITRNITEIHDHHSWRPTHKSFYSISGKKTNPHRVLQDSMKKLCDK